MKTLYRILFVAALGLSLQACSGSVEFVLVNASDTTIEVEYEADMKSHMPPGSAEVPEAFIPKTMGLGKWESSHKWEDWTPLAGTEYRVDVSTGKFKLKIPPRTALRLAWVSDSLFFEDGYRDFQLKKLEVRGIYGSLALDGVQLFREFTKNGRQVCSITYTK